MPKARFLPILSSSILPDERYHVVPRLGPTKAEARIMEQAGQPGSGRIAPNLAGRGADIAVPDPVNSSGGLHVILTERHDAARIDRQLQGRTGRHGAPGTYENILSL